LAPSACRRPPRLERTVNLPKFFSRPPESRPELQQTQLRLNFKLRNACAHVSPTGGSMLSEVHQLLDNSSA
jgi:hypothetical protein